MDPPTKTIKISDIFTDAELKLAIHLHEITPPSLLARELCDRITTDAIFRINQVTGQDNDPLYWAYALVNALNTAERNLESKRGGDPL